MAVKSIKIPLPLEKAVADAVDKEIARVNKMKGTKVVGIELDVPPEVTIPTLRIMIETAI